MTSNAEEIYERLIKEDFSCFKDVSSRIPQDVYVLLAEHLAIVFSKQFKLSPLLAWAIKNEVENTKHFNLLFREDSLSKALVNRILFDNVGIKYLRLLLAPMIQKINESNRPLKIGSHKVDEAESTENMKHLLAAVDIFVTTFQESEMSCPLIVRKLFMYLNDAVTEKFKEDSGPVPFSLHFFFFQYVCLAMISPDKYHIVDAASMTDSLRVGLLSASKLLKDLAGQTARDGDSSVFQEYQKSKGPLLMDCFRSLIDPKSIKTVESILMANTTTLKPKPEDIQHYKESFINFLLQHNLHSISLLRKQSISVERSTELEAPATANKLGEELVAALNDVNWKQKKKKNLVFNVLKDKNKNTFSIKTECVISVPLEEAVNFYHLHYLSPKYDPSAYDWDTLYQGVNYREMHVKFKLPSPVLHRDFSLSEWLVYPEQGKTLIVVKSNNNYPTQTGFIRGNMIIMGFEFTALSPNETRIRAMGHGDPFGSVPRWVINGLVIEQAEKFVKIRKDIDIKRVKSASGSGSGSENTSMNYNSNN